VQLLIGLLIVGGIAFAVYGAWTSMHGASHPPTNVWIENGHICAAERLGAWGASEGPKVCS
jgi:hypothetical protein